MKTITKSAKTKMNELAQEEYNQNQAINTEPVAVEMTEKKMIIKFGGEQEKKEYQPSEMNFVYAEIIYAALKNNNSAFISENRLKQIKGILGYLCKKLNILELSLESFGTQGTETPPQFEITIENFSTELFSEKFTKEYLVKLHKKEVGFKFISLAEIKDTAEIKKQKINELNSLLE